MNPYNDARERDVLLLDGTHVNEAIYGWVIDLIAHGHRINVSDHGDVRVDPPCNPDVLYCLNASYSETRAIVAELSTKHVVH